MRVRLDGWEDFSPTDRTTIPRVHLVFGFLAGRHSPSIKIEIGAARVLLFAYHLLIPVTPVRVIVRIAIIAAVSIKASTKTKATASQTIVSDSATIYRDPVATGTAVAHRVTSAAKTAVASAMAASAVASPASCERGCAGRRCRYAERDDRSRRNYLFAHFSKVLMFDLICGTV
jgi:hypothetical protein